MNPSVQVCKANKTYITTDIIIRIAALLVAPDGSVFLPLEIFASY